MALSVFYARNELGTLAIFVYLELKPLSLVFVFKRSIVDAYKIIGLHVFTLSSRPQERTLSTV